MAGIAQAELGSAVRGGAQRHPRAPHSALAGVAHGVPPLVLMLAPALAGHAAIAMIGSICGLAALSIGYAPAARTERWAREHIADLWAMVVVMLIPLWGGGPRGHGAGHVAGSAAQASPAEGNGLSALLIAGIVLIWAIGRVSAAARSRGRGDAAASAASGALCAVGIVWMLAA